MPLAFNGGGELLFSTLFAVSGRRIARRREVTKWPWERRELVTTSVLREMSTSSALLVGYAIVPGTRFGDTRQCDVFFYPCVLTYLKIPLSTDYLTLLPFWFRGFYYLSHLSVFSVLALQKLLCEQVVCL